MAVLWDMVEPFFFVVVVLTLRPEIEISMNEKGKVVDELTDEKLLCSVISAIT
jgi:hypothetical protein